MTDWSSLSHAYGTATDTPAHLEALVGGSASALSAAQEHMWSAILHQGTVWPATGPAVGWLAERLLEDAFADDERTGWVLRFAAEAARETREATEGEPDWTGPTVSLMAEDDDWEDEAKVAAYMWDGILRMRAVAGSVREAASRFVVAPSPEVRAAAVDALAQAALLEGEPDAARATVAELADSADGPSLTGAVLALGELGEDTTRWLDHPDMAVRVAAAHGRLADRRARRVIIDALMDPEAFDAAVSRIGRFEVIGELARSGAPPDELLPVALAQLPPRDRWTGSDWVPFLVAFRSSPVLTTYLAALVGADDIWDPRNGNLSLAFKDAGLPYDRERCAEIAGVELPGLRRFWRR